jgi:hypothetical protein
MRDLTLEEFEALSRLQEGSPAPEEDDPVWESLISLRLVWRDDSVRPPRMRLTSEGRMYRVD